MSSPMERLTTALADRYRIERELGQGGMATVYLAQDLRHDRKVALKVLKPELAAVLGGDRFVVEIKTTAALQHPHILPLFDSGTADGFLYYVMPFIEGETLRGKLDRETQLGIEEAVRITSNVADALDYAHRHGVIHRDIKPENILLHDGRPMVADFGIALAVSAAAGGRMTETGLSLGTPHYMSPEQATAEKELTNRSDIYSLGCVLYEMLTGSPPHVGATAQQIVMKIVMDPVRPVTELRKTVPLHVAAAVGKAVEKLPADRFESAKAFAEALANPAFGAGTIGMTALSGSAYQRRSKKTLGLVAAIALLATIAAIWGWLRPEPARPVRWFTVALPDSVSLAGGGVYRLAVAPDGERLAYAARGSARQAGGGIWLRRLDQLGATRVVGTDGGVNPSFSPDGRQLAFLAQGTPRSLRVVSLTGGPAITLTDSLVDVGGLAWGHDGYIYYDGHLEGDGIARVRETGGVPEIVTRPDSAGGERYHNAPAPLPNQRGVLFTTVRDIGRPEVSEIAVVDLETGKHRTLTRGVLAIYSPTGHLLYVTSDGTLMAAPFDQDRLALTGEGVAITGGVSTRGVSRADLALANGTLVYAAGDPVLNREMVWVTRDGVATAVDPAWTRSYGYPRISPDGRRVTLSVVEGGPAEVWVKQLDRGPALRLTAQGGRSGTWFPNDQRILYGGREGLLSVPADGSSLPALVRATTGTVPMMLPELSPDGLWMSYSVRGNLYLARVSGDTGRRDVATTTALETTPAISPTGRWIAYTSNESGQFEVYVRPFPETQTTRWQVSTGGGANPRWRRGDGSELFFVRPNGDLVAVPVGPGPVFTAGVPSVLFSTEPFQSAEPAVGYDVHPDGKRFLMLRQIGGARLDELILVENLPAVLQTRVAPR